MGKVIFLALIVYFVLRSFWDLRESGERKRHPSLEIPLKRDGELDKYFRSHGIDTDADKADFVERAATVAAFEENKKGWD
jgi:hypothetical protein